MRRTEAAGNDSNLYTEGNVTLGVPATVVGAIEMNLIQEEIVNVVLAEGITLDATGVDDSQLNDALDLKVGKGGLQSTFAVANNVLVATDVTGLVFSNTSFVGVAIDFYLHRRTDTNDVLEQGVIRLAYDPEAANWRINVSSAFDDALVAFTVTAAGQVQYTSSNLTGTSYSGSLKMIIKNITA